MDIDALVKMLHRHGLLTPGCLDPEPNQLVREIITSSQAICERNEIMKIKFSVWRLTDRKCSNAGHHDCYIFLVIFFVLETYLFVLNLVSLHMKLCEYMLQVAAEARKGCLI